MTVLDLLSDCILPAKTSDVVGEAVSQGIRDGYQHIPVVNEDGRLAGLAKISELIEVEDVNTPLADCRLEPPVAVNTDSHILDAIKLIAEHDIDPLPVVDGDGRYLGAVTATHLLKPLSRLLAAGSEGAILELEVPKRDYALSQLIHVIEEHSARVQCILSQPLDAAGELLQVTIKLSVSDTARIRAVLEHHGFQVTRIARDESNLADLQRRIKEFMHYLEV